MRNSRTYLMDRKRTVLGLFNRELAGKKVTVWLLEMGIDVSFEATKNQLTLTLPSAWRFDELSDEATLQHVVYGCLDHYGRLRVRLTETSPTDRRSGRHPKLTGLEMLCRFVFRDSADDPRVKGLILDRATGRSIVLTRNASGRASDEQRAQAKRDLTNTLTRMYPQHLEPTAYWDDVLDCDPTSEPLSQN
ncbi:MAG: hypothetical protein ABIJ46_02150 [bacterium]